MDHPVVVVAYGPRSVPALQLAQAAKGLCSLVWLVDNRDPQAEQLARLLSRFGPVLDGGGKTPERIAKELEPYSPDGLVTYFDAGMVDLARIAAELRLRFVSPRTAQQLVDKAAQREA